MHRNVHNPEDFAVTITKSEGSVVPNRGAQWRIDVVAEHKPTGAKIGDWFEGFYIEPQIEKKADEMAKEVLRDLCVVRGLPPPGGMILAARVYPSGVRGRLTG